MAPRTATISSDRASTIRDVYAPVRANLSTRADLVERLRFRIRWFHIIEGQVRNVSNQPLKNVTAVGIWSDKNGEFIKSDDQGRFDQWLRVPESTVTSKLILPLPIPKHSILHVAGNVW